MDMGRGRGGGDVCSSNMETDITTCKIDGQWEFAVWLKKLKQGLCINLEGWAGEGDGREFQKGGDMCIPTDTGASLIAELVKNPPAM